jgi:hypothetical protein
MCTGYAMAASGRMQYDYDQTNYTVQTNSAELEFGVGRGAFGIGEGRCSWWWLTVRQFGCTPI